MDDPGCIVKNKARLVIKGYSQEERIDYDQTFELVIKLKAIKTLLAIASMLNFKRFQMDVKSVFLIGFIKKISICRETFML